MNRIEEIELLQKRNVELKNIANSLRDVFDWFGRNEGDLESNCNVCDLEECCEAITDAADDIEYEIGCLREQQEEDDCDEMELEEDEEEDE